MGPKFCQNYNFFNKHISETAKKPPNGKMTKDKIEPKSIFAIVKMLPKTINIASRLPENSRNSRLWPTMN